MLMRTFGIIMLCILAVIGSGVAWCNFTYPTYTYRYRMTVEVDVDGVVHSGSSVIEIEIQTQPNVLANSTTVSQVHGEAIFVDLGRGHNVIALLASGPNGSNVDYPDQIVPRLFNVSYDKRDLPTLGNLHGRQEIPEQYLPTFVMFGDLSNPKTARVLKPDELPQVFGPGVRFKRAWIEMTDERVTRAIEQQMPMLTTHRDEIRRIIDDMPPRFQPHFHYFSRK
jgi:hypothetical protein